MAASRLAPRRTLRRQEVVAAAPPACSQLAPRHSGLDPRRQTASSRPQRRRGGGGQRRARPQIWSRRRRSMPPRSRAARWRHGGSRARAAGGHARLPVVRGEGVGGEEERGVPLRGVVEEVAVAAACSVAVRGCDGAWRRRARWSGLGVESGVEAGWGAWPMGHSSPAGLLPCLQLFCGLGWATRWARGAAQAWLGPLCRAGLGPLTTRPGRAWARQKKTGLVPSH